MDSLTTLPLSNILNVLLLPASILVIIFFRRRTGTSQSIMELLWRVICGNTPIKDQRLAAFVEEARELERFRFIFGLNVASLAEVHRFLDWREKNQIPIAQIELIRKWLDAKSPHFIIEPRRAVILRHSFFGFLCIAGVIGAEALIISDSAYLKAKESKVWFVSDGFAIKKPFWDVGAETLDCQAISTMGFTSAEKEIFCRGLQEGSLKSVVDNAVQKQRMLGLCGVLLFLSTALHFIRQMEAAASARKLLAQINKSTNLNSRPCSIQRSTSPANTTTAT